jgi:hypothetical protein
MKISASTILFALCISGTLLAQDVRFNSEPGADFSKYRTYRWAEHPDSKQVNPATLSQLGQAFDAALAKKGLQRVNGDTSDLLIVFQLATGQDKMLTTFTNEYVYGPGWRPGWYSTTGGSLSAMPAGSKISSGQVVLDMYDTSTKHLVWRGMVSKTLDSKAKPEQQQKNIAKAADKLIKTYPPKK